LCTFPSFFDFVFLEALEVFFVFVFGNKLWFVVGQFVFQSTDQTP